MSVTFYAENRRNSATSAWLRLPASLADYLLFALAYPLLGPGNVRELLPADLLVRTESLRRQFALGRGREFTSTEVDETQLLSHLEELEKVAERARDGGTSVLLFDA
ncbi:MAG TPA: hypothetical protein VG013_08530 [Gemmataceae bacterium]|nr:hypothetical protein [Gemmataceae bacterium]